MSVLPEMIYKSTEEMINKLDSNKDGVITADEMKNSKDKTKSKSVNYSVGVTVILFVILSVFAVSYFSKYRYENCLGRRFVTFLSSRRKPLELS